MWKPCGTAGCNRRPLAPNATYCRACAADRKRLQQRVIDRRRRAARNRQKLGQAHRTLWNRSATPQERSGLPLDAFMAGQLARLRAAGTGPATVREDR